MTPSRPSGDVAPTPEQLTAYVDGQLDAATRTGVEAWLRAHPEAALDIEGQSRLARLWQATAPAEPEEARWAALLARLHSRWLRSRSAPARVRRYLGMGVAAALTAAALLLLFWTRGTKPAEQPIAIEPLTVVSPDDVEIVSLRAADRATLVVGVPPVTGPLVLASAGDVHFDRIEPAADGMIPEIHMEEGAVVPMIVAPLDAVPSRAPGDPRE